MSLSPNAQALLSQLCRPTVQEDDMELVIFHRKKRWEVARF